MLKNTIKKSCHLSHWCIFCSVQICVDPLCTSLKWVPELCCCFAKKKKIISSHFIFLSLSVFVLSLPLSGLHGSRPQNGSMILYNRKKVKYRKDGYCWKKRKDGKTTREDHMKLKVQGVEVSVLGLDLERVNGEKRRGKCGYQVGRNQPSSWHRQTQVYSELSLGCNGDGRMLQSACVSKEPYRETMQHNNSFPWEAGGVEPIVCTLLKLWMLPLLQRAYINLAGSKQYCGASIPTHHFHSHSVPYHCNRQGLVVSVPGSPRHLLEARWWKCIVGMTFFTFGPCIRPGKSQSPKSFTSFAINQAEVLVILTHKQEFR